MIFHVLGPLTVHFGSSERGYRSGREARILGAFLIQAGQPVTTDDLVDLLWAEAPPATARQQVQNCASTVDRLLRRHGHPLLRRIANGYQLDAPDDLLDMLAFERDLRAARISLARSDPTEAVARLRAALGYWRGDVLAGTALGHLEPVAVRLRELRLEALESYFGCEVQLGQAASVLSELAAATRTYPMRERLVSHLMRALAQTGRVGDALELFGRTRQSLVELYGIEPSRLLRTALADVLRQNDLGVVMH